jgi:hypothetical protein
MQLTFIHEHIIFMDGERKTRKLQLISHRISILCNSTFYELQLEFMSKRALHSSNFSLSLNFSFQFGAEDFPQESARYASPKGTGLYPADSSYFMGKCVLCLSCQWMAKGVIALLSSEEGGEVL